ncbi:MAG: hypothetical protein A2X11_15385 [Bacteroidetes bacterium GWE2_42_24]|nr:MAG: hypothetical protein A2X11_15385 [Bacteroidetes bacterium GWE2_42_24]OFY31745.1 MAG: hypothetical protein A2X09_09130 [Bacteroidetes bacterium GWF2_43_11]
MFRMLLLLGCPGINAQVVITNPPFPTVNDQVIITYDATLGNGVLAGETPPVYAHTGVITNLSTSGTDWKYVIAEWNENTDKAKLTPIGNDKYTLTIGPSIRDFYGVPEGEEILKMAFVFRNAGGTIVGRSADNSDIFADVYEAGLNLNIQSPENGTLVSTGSVVNFQTEASNATLVELYVDGIFNSSSSTSPFTGSITIGTTGLHMLRFVAHDATTTMSDSVWLYARGTIPVAELPAGVSMGINYIDNETVTLVLNDPPALKQFVYLLGDFNNWLPSEQYQMNRTSDGTFYWLTINNLTPGTEYALQYWIDGELKIAEPYCAKILDPWNDQNIPSTTYPNLKPYPTGKTTGIVSVFQTAQEPYQWQVEHFATPSPEGLIIYELHIRDFVATHAINTVKDTLDYLQGLGVNAIELMPVNEFEGNDSWGYNPAFYFAPDKAYGQLNDYKAFIDECHNRGIAVIIDMVLNHSYGQSPLLQMYFDPGAGGDGQPSADNPWYNQTCPHEPWCWGYDFNHQSLYTQAFVDSVNHYWLEEFKVDGFRFDFTKGFTNVVGDGWNYDATRINTLKRMNNHIKQVKPDALVILEHLTTNSEEKVLADEGMLLWGNLSGTYGEASMGDLPNSNFSAISYKAPSRNWNAPHLVGYMESHDEERCMFKNLNEGKSSDSYNIKELTTALKRQELTGAFFFTVPGPKMIWQFGELGYDVSIDDPCRVCAKPMHWEYQQDWRRAYLYNVWSSLIHLRRSYEVFSTTDFTISASGAYKKISLNQADMNAKIIGNFDVADATDTPGFQHTGWWYDYFAGDSIQVTDVAQAIMLAPGEYRIYTDKRLEKPAIGTGLTLPATTAQPLRVYPNPADEVLFIDFVAGKASEISIQVYNMTGSRVLTTSDLHVTRGMNNLSINTTHLPAGLYILQLQQGDFRYTERILIR